MRAETTAKAVRLERRAKAGVPAPDLSGGAPLRARAYEAIKLAGRLRARDVEGIAAATRAHIESFRATIAKSL